MPYYRQIEVDVMDENGRALKEYGETRNSRMRLKSCFIQSHTNKTFRISIKPDDDMIWPIRNQDRYDSAEVDEFGRDRQRRRRPWHLLATLRLDGREDIEKKAFVVLDRFEDGFSDDGHVILKSTSVRDENGNWRECGWVFRDVGIDITFENLQLDADDQTTIHAQPEEELTDAFEAMGAGESAEKDEQSKVGQIEVRLDRVKLGETVSGRLKDRTEGLAMRQLRSSTIGDAKHTIGRTKGQAFEGPKRTQYYCNIDEDYEPYAIFRFNYCDERKLRKLGFLEPLPASKKTNKREEALRMAAMLQKKKKPANTYKFRNMEAAESDDGHDGDDEKSESDVDDEGSEEDGLPSEDRPLGDLGEKLGELDMYRTRKRDKEDSEEAAKKPRAD